MQSISVFFEGRLNMSGSIVLEEKKSVTVQYLPGPHNRFDSSLYRVGSFRFSDRECLSQYLLRTVLLSAAQRTQEFFSKKQPLGLRECML